MPIMKGSVAIILSEVCRKEITPPLPTHTHCSLSGPQSGPQPPCSIWKPPQKVAGSLPWRPAPQSTRRAVYRVGRGLCGYPLNFQYVTPQSPAIVLRCFSSGVLSSSHYRAAPRKGTAGSPRARWEQSTERTDDLWLKMHHRAPLWKQQHKNNTGRLIQIPLEKCQRVM